MHTHYTLEEASNPPKEKGFYFVKYHLKSESEAIRSIISHGGFLYTGNEWINHDCPADMAFDFVVTHWLRPVTEEERAKEMGAFAAWCSMNKWVFFPIENEWKKIHMLRTFWKTQDELLALFTQEREKQKQQKGENNA